MKGSIEELDVLRELTRTTGVLHDAQILQLRMWPLVISNHIVSNETKVDMDAKRVDFDMKTKGRAPKDFKERCGQLNQWVKRLLGEDWVVRVLVKGKVFYRGNKRQVSKARKEANA